MTSTDSVTAHLAVFSDIENTKENAELPPTKLGGKGSTNERAVLKPVNQNTNRIQPFRAAKQVCVQNKIGFDEYLLLSIARFM